MIMVEQGKRRTPTWSRWLFGLLALSAFVSGYVGMYQFVHPREPGRYGYWLDLLYYDLQLFAIDSAPVSAHGGPFPWPLELARVLAPVTTVFAIAVAGWVLLGDEVRRIRLRRTRGHAIVTGDTPAALAVRANLKATNVRVVPTSATDAEGLKAAGIAHAATLYACAESDDAAINVATAFAAAKLREKSPGLKVYAQVSDPTLALALRARRVGLPHKSPVQLDFFNVEELAARTLFQDERLRDLGRFGQPHILVIGAGTFGQAVIIELARGWLLRSGRANERVEVTLVDPKAAAVKAELIARWREVAQVCELRPVEAELVNALSTIDGLSPDRTYLCHDDEELALRTALTAVQLWRAPVVVRLNRLAHHGEIFHTPGPQVVDDVSGKLRMVSVTDLGCRPDMIGEDLTEWLARSIHNRYLMEQQREGQRLGSGALVEWDNLDDDKRQANRGQAADIGAKLNQIRATVAPIRVDAPPFEFTNEEVERLAPLEHDRWVDERTQAGWRYDATRDDARKLHPAMVPWDKLDEPNRNRDREAVRSLPEVLAGVGLRISRLGDPREAHVDSSVGAGTST